MSTTQADGARSRVDALQYEATEAGLSLLARKLRAELTLALFESFVNGERTGRSMLAEFERIQEHFRAELPVVKAASTAQSGPDGGGSDVAPPEWDRLRLQARARENPIALWEMFHGLDQLTQQQRDGAQPPGDDITVVDVERAMDLHDSVGESWSLHDELKTARAKLGEHYVPAEPSMLAGMLQRVDAARTLIKEGQYQVGIRPTPHAEAEAQTMSEPMMRRMEAQIEPAMIAELTERAALGLVERGARTSQQRTDVFRAMQAGESRALAARAQESARTARAHATELRSERMSARSTLIWAATAGGGVALTGASLAGQTSLALQTTIGLSLTALGATANLIKDWRVNSETLWAPYKAFGAEKFANLATRLAEKDRHDLDHGTPVNVLRRARNASRSAQLGLVRRAVDPLDRAPGASSTSDTSRGAARDQPGQGQSM
ncbi:MULTISPECIES: hypothetical protein [unclassified Pseudonocardia]|uniref:hypothetical protein n=1 Tax=unclassified Pseudonocardia TaxID=2619320 RepID=UPI0001FFDA7C|nr:hypothetical protein [Pseudonocardia sp. Ae707_Ps1]OLM09056.1 hypothetical protein Ae707Ps1_6003c [Pseudonocardia sp. Ae707_Ps1]